MITYEIAMAVVLAARAPTWDDGDGLLIAAPWGYADSRSFQVPWGAAEWLVDADPAFMPMDQEIALVDRQTGEITWTTYLESADRLDAMEPVGEGHPVEV